MHPTNTSPALTISGRMTLGCGSNVNHGQTNESRQIRDAINWICDRHSLKFGYAFTRQRANGQQNISGRSTTASSKPAYRP